MIYDNTPTVPEEVQLNSADLLSKWGFGDGEWIDWLKEFGTFDTSAVLVELVRRKLIPALDQKVEIEVHYSTNHNPCRAKTVDGEDVVKWHTEADCPVKLTPEWIVVPGAEVLALAREMAQEDSENKERR